MKLRVAINGFGRIGRQVCRRAVDHPDLEIVAINASYPAKTLAHLLKYDSIHGRFNVPVESTDDAIIVGGKPISLVAERNPASLPWRDLEVDLVLEATGKFRSREGAAGHLTAGASRVIITAPAKGAVDATLLYGINHQQFDPVRHQVISAASCTTNCLSPVAKVLHEEFGIISGLMTTVHSYTTDQRLLDNPHKDLRRARGAGSSIIPTSTGAAKTVGEVLPELAGKLNGLAFRVPTPDASVVDLVARLEKPATALSVNNALRRAADGPLKGILGYCDEELVSSDFIGDDRSAIVDSLTTMVGLDNLVKVIAWYDNEWGYSCRVVDLAAHVARVTANCSGSVALAGD